MNKTQASNFIANELLGRYKNAKLSPKQVDDWLDVLMGFDYEGSVNAVKELSSRSRTIPLISDFRAAAAKYKPIKAITQSCLDYNSIKRKYLVCTKSYGSLIVGYFTPKHLIGGQMPTDAEIIQAYSKKYNAEFEIVEATFDQLHKKYRKL